MNIPRLSLLARKVHRIFLWLMTISGVIQAVTGLAQEYPAFQFASPLIMVRIHTLNSVVFSIIFLVSMVTGLFLYFTPWFIKHFKNTS